MPSQFYADESYPTPRNYHDMAASSPVPHMKNGTRAPPAHARKRTISIFILRHTYFYATRLILGNAFSIVLAITRNLALWEM